MAVTRYNEISNINFINSSSYDILIGSTTGNILTNFSLSNYIYDPS